MADIERHIPFQGQARPGGASFTADQVRYELERNSRAISNVPGELEEPLKAIDKLRIPTLENPVVAINIRFPFPEKTLIDGIELQRRWQNFLVKPPQKAHSAYIFTFDPNVIGDAVAVIIPGMIEFRMQGNPNQTFAQIGQAVLTQPAAKPEAYFTNVSGIRPQEEDETVTHVLRSMERTIDEKAVINMRTTFGEIGFDLLGFGQKLYMNNGENYYVVDIEPDMNNPFQLEVNQRSNRVDPVTLDRVQQTLDQDLRFFHQTVVKDVVQRIMGQKVA